MISVSYTHLSQAGSAPQGDANLAGARFDIVNASGKNALVGGRSYGDGEVVKTIEAEWDAAAKAYVAATGSGDLPCGAYKVVESQAPEGYLASDWSKTEMCIRDSYKYGHVAIYVGGDEYIHEPRTGDVCRKATGISYFTCALRYTG